MSPMVKAIWRAAAPGRLGMFLAILTVLTLARLGGAVSEGDRWVGSESQATVSVIVLWLVLPVFVAMLATALLRGEHAPWSWGLARPISRFRLIGSLVALDAVTIAACMLVASIVLGGFGGMWGMLGGGLETAATPVFAGLYAGLYMLGAITGTRTSSTVRAAAAAVGILTMLLVSLWSLASWAAQHALDPFGLHEPWDDLYIIYGLQTWSAHNALWEPHTWWVLSGILIAVAAIGGTTLAFVRSAQLVPAPARWCRLMGPTLGIVCLSAVLFVAGSTLAYLTAPAEAKTGHITIRVTPRVVDPDLTAETVRFRFDGGAVPRRRSYTAFAKRHHGVWTLANLSAGHFEACVGSKLRLPLHAGGAQVRRVEHCEALVVTDEPVQALTIEVGDRRSPGTSRSRSSAAWTGP